MAKHKITGSNTDTVIVTGADGIWVVTPGADVTVSGKAALTTDESTGNIINIYGTLTATDYMTVTTWGDDTTFNVGKAGKITGQVQIVGANDHFTNNGTLDAAESSWGLTLDGDGSTLVNNGSIMGSASVRGDHVMLVNGTTGTIDGASVGTGSMTGEHTTIKNFGVINSTGALGINTSDSDDRIVNRGTVSGEIATGWGNDVIDNRHGTANMTVEGQTSPAYIIGGPGDDVFITDSADYTFFEFNDVGAGDDTIKSSVTYALDPEYYVEHLVLIGKADINGTGTLRGEELVGNSGANTLDGLDGDDTLNGKGGNDKLVGDLGGDLFVFGKGYGKDTIEDFTQGTDRIDISDLGLRPSFNDVLAHAHDHNGNVWVQADDDILVIRHLQKADLTAADFGLVS